MLSREQLNTPRIDRVASGEGSLQGLLTDPVEIGTTVQFLAPADGEPYPQPQQWVLDRYTNQSGEGFQQGCDFDALTNKKIWRRIS